MRFTAKVRHFAARTLPRSVVTRWAVYQHLRTGEPELALVPGLLGAHGALVDVGANEGPYSLLAAHLRRRVIAFEPNPTIAAGLRRSLGPLAQVHDAALSDTTGAASFFVPYEGKQEVSTRGSLEETAHIDFERRQIRVEMATLDSFDLRGIALIKIDVEGHEWPVLRGGMQTLHRELPNLLIEIEQHRSPGNLERIRDLLAPLGYEGHFLIGRNLCPLSTFSAHQYQPAENEPRWGQPRTGTYINNFVWISPSHPDTLSAINRGGRRSALLTMLRTF